MMNDIPMPRLRTALLLALFVLIAPAAVLGHEASISPATSGGIADNPFTAFEGGGGPGSVCTMGMPDYRVNTATRRPVVQDTDFAYSGLGPRIAMTRTYNVPQTAVVAGMFGNAWSLAYESTIDHSGQALSPKTVSLRRGSGQTLAYSVDLSQPPPVRATPAIASPDTLTWHGTHWLYVRKDTRHAYRYEKVASKELSRLTSIADLDENAVTIGYNPDGTIGTVTDAAGRTTSFAYDASKRCKAMSTPDGRQASYEYDAAGDLVATIDLLGYVSTFVYDASHAMTRMTAGGKTTVFAPTSGEATIDSLTDASGNTTFYGRDAYYYANASTDPEGGVRLYFDTGQEGWTRLVVDALGNSSPEVEYDFELGLPHYMDDNASGGALTVVDRDSTGNPVELSTIYRDAGSGSFRRITKKLVFDAGGNAVAVTRCLNDTQYANCVGVTWSYAYDARHHLTRIRSPLGLETTLSYDARGQLASVTDPAGASVGFTYDAFGNLKTATDAGGNVTTWSYGPQGLSLASLTDARGNATSFETDANGRVTGVTRPDGTTRRYAYDCCTLTAVTDEGGRTTTIAHDEMLRVTRVTDPLGHAASASYDGNGNLVEATDAIGRVASSAYDASNRLAATTDRLGGTRQYAYDQRGNVVSLTDARGNATSFAYAHDNRVLSTTDPLARAVAVTRDALGRVVSARNARGLVVAFNYDANGRIASKTYDGITAATYGYDAAGNLVATTDATGTTTYAYDARRKAIGVGYPDGKAVAIAYDAVGNPSSISYPGGLIVNHTYDSLNRITYTTWEGNSIAYAYDASGQVVRETRSNGTESAYDYDADGRIASIQHRNGAAAFASIAYARDAVGNITQEDSALPATATIAVESAAATVDAANALSTWGGDAFVHDADGNLTGITGSRAFAGAYDHENRLVSIARGGTTTTYAYDALGNRTRAAAGGAIRHFHHDAQGRLLFETDGGGAVVAWFIYSGDTLAAMKSGDGVRFYHFDVTGSTVALTDANGSLAGAYAYAPFGAVAGGSGPGANPFTYVGAGGVMDEGGGLYFMRHRWYDAVTGRFIQRDPVGFAGGETNLYAYVGGNPVSRIDPLGLIGTDEAFDRYAQSVRDTPPEWRLPAVGLNAYDAITSGESWGSYIFDKAMNFVERAQLGTVYQGSKALRYLSKGEKLKAAIEVGKGVISAWAVVQTVNPAAGPATGLMLDSIQDYVQAAISGKYDHLLSTWDLLPGLKQVHTPTDERDARRRLSLMGSCR